MVMVSNINLVKGHDCSDSDVIMYASIKYYSFGGSVILPYAQKLVRPYEGLFPTQAGLLLDNHSIASIQAYHNSCISVGILLP